MPGRSLTSQSRWMAGPKVVTFVANGKLCDGGDFRQFGWGRFNPYLRSANGSDQLRIGDGVTAIKIYGRALRTAEAIQNQLTASR